MATEASIITVTIRADETSYTFAHRQTDADLSGLSASQRATLRGSHWLRDTDPASSVFLTEDADEQTALESSLSSLSVTFTVSDVSLTTSQKADVVASGIRSKKYIPKYLEVCGVLRAEGGRDTAGRARAKGQIVAV